jgi:hypothetical protein
MVALPEHLQYVEAVHRVQDPRAQLPDQFNIADQTVRTLAREEKRLAPVPRSSGRSQHPARTEGSA